MRRILGIAALATLALAACAGPGPRGPRDLKPLANPSAIVAAEFAFATAAQQKGQWTAFRDYADDDAVMFVPQPVKAKDWLKKQADPPQSVTWQAHSVWMSCDASLAVSKGAWQRPDGTVGYFTTVWKRQRNGSYKWVLDQGDTLAQPLAAPEMIAGQVADCGRGTEAAAADFEANLDAGRFSEGSTGGGTSDDHTLTYAYTVAPDGARKFRVGLFQDGRFRQVVNSQVAAR